MPVSETLSAYIIIGYFSFKETNFRWKNIVNDLILNHCYLYVILYLKGQLINSLNVFSGKTVS